MGDVEISPAGLSCGIWTLDRATERLHVGIAPHVISHTTEAAGIDARRIDFVEHFGSQEPTVYHVARRLLHEQQTSGLGGRLSTEALVTELVIYRLRQYASHGGRECEGGVRRLAPDQRRPPWR